MFKFIMIVNCSTTFRFFLSMSSRNFKLYDQFNYNTICEFCIFSKNLTTISGFDKKELKRNETYFSVLHFPTQKLE